MRISQAAIHGGRPTTRFAVPVGYRGQRQFGLRRNATVSLAIAPARGVVVSPLIALRRAARGVTRDGSRRLLGAPVSASRALLRSDRVSWSRGITATGHRARSRSAAPWRG
jgi:hypothetical protein